MSETDQTAFEVFNSVTGFDEMAIAQHFGRTVGDLFTGDSSMWARAMAFVVKRRAGANDDDARNASLEMSLLQLSEFFAEESEGSGKDEPGSEPQPESSPSSAS
jgi:hypothetical protein